MAQIVRINAKDVPFLALVDTAANLGHKNNFGGVNRHFPAKLAKYWDVHIIKTTGSIITKFLQSDRDPK